MIRRIATFFVILLSFLAFSMFVYAHARELVPGQYDNVDQATKDWFNTLRNAKTDTDCCKEADCEVTDYTIDGDHYVAFLSVYKMWIPIPQTAVLEDVEMIKKNPTGNAVVCYNKLNTDINSLKIFCFTPGAGL